jgi:hypothetical protein
MKQNSKRKKRKFTNVTIDSVYEFQTDRNSQVKRRLKKWNSSSRSKISQESNVHSNRRWKQSEVVRRILTVHELMSKLSLKSKLNSSQPQDHDLHSIICHPIIQKRKNKLLFPIACMSPDVDCLLPSFN